MADSPVLYVYFRPDNDDAYPGVPARHITEADWARFSLSQRRTVEQATTQEGYTRRKVWVHRDLVDETEQERADREAAEQAARAEYDRKNSLVRYGQIETMIEQLEVLPSAEEFEGLRQDVDAVADLPPRVEALTPGPGKEIVGGEAGPVERDILFDTSPGHELPAAYNMVANPTVNKIAPDVRSSTILGGGHDAQGRQNIIGGEVSTVGTTAPNVVKLGTVANYSVIAGAYDNVVANLAGSIVGGAHHKITGSHGTVSGGSFGEAGGAYSGVFAGTDNKAMGNRSVVVGGSGNRATATNSTAIGGQNNTASASDTIAMGQGNTASQTGAVAVGLNNTASGASALALGQGNAASTPNAIALGQGNSASGDGAVVLGRTSSATMHGAVALGTDAKAYTYGMVAHASGKFTKQGDAQAARLTLRAQTTDATPRPAGTLGTSLGSHLMQDGSAAMYRLQVIAREAATNDTKGWTIEGVANNPPGANVELVGGAPTPSVIAESAGASAWDCYMDVGPDTLIVRVVGEADKTINWVALLEFVEVVV